LREAWFDAPTLEAQKEIARQVQVQALETRPFVPLGQIFQPAAFRSDITDIVTSSFPVFWGARRT
jgi:peptide/nickel transport system substrate-binding protein